MKRIPLVSLQEGYFVFDPQSNTALGVSWLDHAPDRYISADSLPDGSWAIEAFWSDAWGAAPYRIYWLYPFSCRVHCWTLDSRGHRVDGQDLSLADSLIFLRQRLEEGPLFLTRLFLLLAAPKPVLIDTNIVTRVAALALQSAVEDALFCVCAHPEYFGPEALDRAVDHIIERFSLIRAVPPPLWGAAIWKQRLAAFHEALQRSRPTRLAEVQEQIDLATNYSDVLNTARSHSGIVPVGRMQHIHLQRKSYDEMAAMCAPIENPALVFRVEFSPNGEHPPVVCHTSASGMIHQRLMVCIGFMYTILRQHVGREDFLKEAAALGFRPNERRLFFFQGWDGPSETERPSVSFERSVGNQRITLVPDLYYFESHGYRDMMISLRQTAVPWSDKRATFMWRGSTTGQFITLDNFDNLPRYRLCRAGRALGTYFDAGITDIVQTDSPATQAVLAARLREEGILLPYVPQARMTEYRYVIDIDGNSNSWGFFAKLLLGSCVLKVASPFEQWFYPELVAWTHYVPISADLSDLTKIVEWCLAHDDECAKIAACGYAFAMERHIDRENRRAAHDVLAASLPAV